MRWYRAQTLSLIQIIMYSVFGLAIGGYFLYSKLKKPEQNLIDVPPPPVAKTNTEPKRDILKCSKNFYHIIYIHGRKLYERFKRERLSRCSH